MIIGQRFEDLINIEPKVIKIKLLDTSFFKTHAINNPRSAFYLFYQKNVQTKRGNTMK